MEALNSNPATATELRETKTQAIPESAFFPLTSEENIDECETALDTARAFALANSKIKFFDTVADQTMPEGFGVAIRTVSQAKKVVALIIAPVPTVDTLAEHDKGAEYIVEKVQNALLNKLADAIRPRNKDDVIAGVLPRSITDFILTAPRGDGLGSYNELATVMLPLVRKTAGGVTKASLRRILANTAFAEQSFPTIPQDKWETVINVFVKLATKKSLDIKIFQHWLETRADGIVEQATIDEDAFDALLAMDDADAPIAE